MSSSDSPWTVVKDQVVVGMDDDDDSDDEFADAMADAHDDEEQDEEPQQQASSSVSTTTNGDYESANDNEDVDEEPLSNGGIAELSTTLTTMPLSGTMDYRQPALSPSLLQNEQPEPLEMEEEKEDPFGALGDAAEPEPYFYVQQQSQSTLPEDSLGAPFGDEVAESDRTCIEEADPPLPSSEAVMAAQEDSLGALGKAAEPAEAETFDVAPPQLHNTDVEREDSFGAFGEATEPYYTLDSAPPQPSLVDENSLGAAATLDVAAQTSEAVAEEDSFGAFGKAPLAQPHTLDASPQPSEAVAEEDSVGAFGEAEVAKAEIVAVASLYTATEGEDSFGVFGEATDLYALDSAPLQLSLVEEDSFGAFGAAETFDVAPQTSETVAEEDSFGAFGEAQPAEPDTLHAAPQPSEAVAEGEDSFGAFGEAEFTEAKTVDVAPQHTETEGDDSFGAFGEAELTEAKTVDVAPQHTETEGDDSFGAFGEAEPGTVIRISPVEKPSEAIESFTVKNNDDSFGAFDEATNLPMTVPPLSEPSGNTIENLGATLAHDTDIMKTQTDAGADDPANEVDDDFGDFAVADPDTEDDGSSDFGAAPSNDQANQEDSGQEEENEDDFGDFEAPKSTVPSPTPITVSDMDPIMQRAQAAFPDLFGRYKPAENIGSSSTRSERETDSVSVQDALLSLDAESKVDEVPCVDASQLLNKLFEDESMFKKANSRIIYSGSGGPFGYLRYPVGGIRPLETSWKAATDGRLLRIVPNNSADTEEIPVPRVATTHSIEASRAISELPQTNSGTATKSFVNGNSSTNSATPSEKVKEFLSRVPDLSYMLSSKLSLPTDK